MPSAELKLSVSLMSKNTQKYDLPNRYDGSDLVGAAGLGRGLTAHTALILLK